MATFRDKPTIPRRDAEIDRLLSETEVMLRNTREFLDRLAGSEQSSQEYLREMEQMLERERDRLQRRKDEHP